MSRKLPQKSIWKICTPPKKKKNSRFFRGNKHYLELPDLVRKFIRISLSNMHLEAWLLLNGESGIITLALSLFGRQIVLHVKYSASEFLRHIICASANVPGVLKSLKYLLMSGPLLILIFRTLSIIMDIWRNCPYLLLIWNILQNMSRSLMILAACPEHTTALLMPCCFSFRFRRFFYALCTQV